MLNIVELLAHAARHPRAILPGAPRGIINDASAWVHACRAKTPADLRRGPAAAIYPFAEQSLLNLTPARDARNGNWIALDRVMPVPAANLYFLRGARVIGNEGAVISSDNRVFSEFTYVDDAGGIHSHAIFRRRRFPRAAPLRGWYATLCYPSAAAYFHWLVECLPRLALLEKYLDSIDGFIVPANIESGLKQSLAAFGIDENRLVYQDVGSQYAPEHLLVPAYCAGRNIPPWVSAFLRNRVLKDRPSAARQRIYVSRANAGKRRIVNENALLPILARHHIKVIRPSELSFIAQAECFDDADFVIGPHGAGLTNALFCRSGSKILELLPSPSVKPGTFHSVSSAAGADYWCMHGERSDASNMPDVHADFFIEPTNFDHALQRVLG